MSPRVAWKWGLCAPGLTILWGSLTCPGCGLPVSVVLRAPGDNQQDPRTQSGPRACLTTKGGGLCLPLPGRAARSQWGTLTTQVIRLAGCKILRDPKGKCTSLL